jgi:hypothetical protein
MRNPKVEPALGLIEFMDYFSSLSDEERRQLSEEIRKKVDERSPARSFWANKGTTVKTAKTPR